MTLDDIITVMVDGVKSHKLVVRLQTGDLSLYGSIREQGEVLAEHNIGFSAIPASVPSSVPQPNWVWNTPYRKCPRA